MPNIRPAAAILCFALACCVPPAPQPTPAPPSAPPAATLPPQATPAPVITPPPSNWIDAPQTAGDWSYGRVDGGSLARFGRPGEPVFGVGCMAGTRRIALLRYGAAAAANIPMIVRTETVDRTLSAQPSNDARSVSAALPAPDPLLDAIAFSRGRFAVEVQGTAPLYLPSWPEVSRVIEDCR